MLTRLPPPARRTPAVVGEILTRRFPASRFLDAAAAADLHDRLASLGLAGGSVYDALVGAAAAQHGLTLLTRDQRAFETYRLLGVTVEVARLPGLRGRADRALRGDHPPVVVMARF